MNLLSPERLIWLAVAIPVVLFYLLKTRIRRLPVATLRFWDDASEPQRRRSISLRLRHWLSLLLQLAFIMFVVAALVDPVRSGTSTESRQGVLILDASASMQADRTAAGQETRWNAAIDAALNQLDAARPGDELALVVAGSQAKVVVGMTDFPPAIRQAIEALQVTDGPAQIEEAIATARRLAPDPARRKLFLFTDGGGAAMDEAATAQADDLQTIFVGETVDNIGITQLQVRRSLVDPIEFTLLVEWENFGRQPVDGRLVLRHDEGLLDVHPFRLAPEQRRRETFQYASAAGGMITAELQVDDALALDNIAQAVLSNQLPTAITLVTDQDEPFLPAVFAAMPNIDLTVTDRWLPQRDEGQLTVLHHVVPQPLPSGPLLVIAPQQESRLWKRQPRLEETLIAEQAESSLLLSNVDLQEVALTGVAPLELSATAIPLLKSAEGATLMAAITEPTRRIVVLTADVSESELPLRVAFPVMMSNAVRWLTDSSFDTPSAFAVGATAELPRSMFPSTAGESRRWIAQMRPVKGPRKPAEPPAVQLPIVFNESIVSVGPFPFAGIYEVVPEQSTVGAMDPDDNVAPDSSRRITTAVTPGPAANDLQRTLAVNLTNAEESDLRAEETLTASTEAQPTVGGGRPWWFYLTLIALSLLVGEWYLFQRKIVA